MIAAVVIFMLFYLGTHRPNWLELSSVPLFVSAVTLRRNGRKRGRFKATCEWSLDSGGFTELSTHGAWRGSDHEYAGEVNAWADRIGGLRWAAVRDHMCEPFILAKTGRTVYDHQQSTIESLVNLRAIAPWISWAPVLQGWTPDDYEAHAQQYRSAGFDLSSEPIVGVGSVCRRQATSEGEAVFRRVAKLGLRIHAFGVKSDGLKRYGQLLASADSMAWSFVARRRKIKLDDCIGHENCANCIRFAMKWRSELAKSVGATSSEPQQLNLGLA